MTSSTIISVDKQVLGFCSIVPKDENDRINTKSSYGDIKKKLGDYNFKN